MRKIARPISVFSILLFAYLFSAHTAYACLCIKRETVDLEFEGTPNVAFFKLSSIEWYKSGEKGYGNSGIKHAKLTVEKVFKGNLKAGQELTFIQGSGIDCIHTFSEKDIGEDFLFYLEAKPSVDNLWIASTCSRSTLIKYAAADLLYLENIAKVKGKTRLSGILAQVIESGANSENSIKLLAGRKVLISGNGKDIELKTDQNGVYEIYDLPAGRYKIAPEKISGYKLNRYESGWVEVEIKAKKHTEQSFGFMAEKDEKSTN